MAVFTAIATAVGLTGLSATVAAGALALGTSAAFSAFQGSLARKQAEKRQREENRKRDWSVPRFETGLPMFAVIGRAPVGGIYHFLENRDDDVFGVLNTGLGPIAGWDEFRIDGTRVLLNGDGGVISAPYAQASQPKGSLVELETRTGASEQRRLDVIADAFPEAWTDAHRLAGLSAIGFRLRAVGADNYAAVYKSRVPDITGIQRGLLLWDPRDDAQDPADPDTWTWSENPAIAALNHLLSTRWGQGRGLADVNVTAAIRCANLCDDRGWTISAVFDLSEDPSDVFDRILESFRGDVYTDSLGRIALTCAPWGRCEAEDPAANAIVITDDHILEMIRARQGQEITSEINSVAPFFRPASRKYAREQAVAVTDAARAEAMGRIVSEAPDLDFVSDHAQARWLASMDLAESNAQWDVECVLAPFAIAILENEDEGDDKRRFLFRSQEWGIEGHALVQEWRESPTLDHVRVRFRVLPATAWEAPVAVELPPLPVDTSQDQFIPRAPVLSAFVCADEKVHVTIDADARTGSTYDVDWREPDGTWTPVSLPSEPLPFESRDGVGSATPVQEAPTYYGAPPPVVPPARSFVLFGADGVAGTGPAAGTTIELRAREVTAGNNPSDYGSLTFTRNVSSVTATVPALSVVALAGQAANVVVDNPAGGAWVAYELCFVDDLWPVTDGYDPYTGQPYVAPGGVGEPDWTSPVRGWNGTNIPGSPGYDAREPAASIVPGPLRSSRFALNPGHDDRREFPLGSGTYDVFVRMFDCDGTVSETVGPAELVIGSGNPFGSGNGDTPTGLGGSGGYGPGEGGINESGGFEGGGIGGGWSDGFGAGGPGTGGAPSGIY